MSLSSSRRNVFAEVSAYKNMLINVIGHFSTLLSFLAGYLGEYAVWRRARINVEGFQFSKDAKQGLNMERTTMTPNGPV